MPALSWSDRKLFLYIDKFVLTIHSSNKYYKMCEDTDCWSMRAFGNQIGTKLTGNLIPVSEVC